MRGRRPTAAEVLDQALEIQAILDELEALAPGAGESQEVRELTCPG